jgi:glc operon protein GlcG
VVSTLVTATTPITRYRRVSPSFVYASQEKFMKSTHQLEAADVKKIAEAAEREALAHQWAVTIAIADAGGHLLWLQRLDGAPPVSAHIAPAKAHTAALGRRESKVYEDVINQGRTSFLSAPVLQGMLEGGVPILKDGQCLGAVGVSGVKSSEDAQIARAGIAAIGL